MNNRARQLAVALLAGAMLCSALVAGCGGGDAAEESVGVGAVSRTPASPPPVGETPQPK